MEGKMRKYLAALMAALMMSSLSGGVLADETDAQVSEEPAAVEETAVPDITQEAAGSVTSEPATAEPTAEVTPEPATAEPTAEVTPEPATAEPTAEATPESATAEPTAEVTPEPATAEPTAEATPESATAEPTAEATPEPATAEPTAEVTPEPATAEPTAEATPEPVEPGIATIHVKADGAYSQRARVDVRLENGVYFIRRDDVVKVCQALNLDERELRGAWKWEIVQNGVFQKDVDESDRKAVFHSDRYELPDYDRVSEGRDIFLALDSAYDISTVQEPAGEPLQVNQDTDVRLAPDGLSEILLTVPAGGTLMVLERDGDWVKVIAEGTEGYVYVDSVEEALPGPEVEPGEEEPAAPEFKVTIFSSRRSVMAPGEKVTLTSKIEGFDGYEIMYQWECDKGSGFENVEGANEDTYSFEADVETLSYDWRLTVYYR